MVDPVDTQAVPLDAGDALIARRLRVRQNVCGIVQRVDDVEAETQRDLRCEPAQIGRRQGSELRARAAPVEPD